ncbi:hypothetical protein PQQ73_29995 [Paraburkholderia strydomiana]|uniref:Uncharacterized protein n=1 Tax=Paraburkholderia strydomiana TaxID=1245417 RepID=A0ABW9ENC9_9BURK
MDGDVFCADQRQRGVGHPEIAGKIVTTLFEQQIGVGVVLVSDERGRPGSFGNRLDDLPLEPDRRGLLIYLPACTQPI